MAKFSRFTQAIIDDYQKYAHIVNEAENISSLFFILISKEFKRNLRLHSIIQNLTGAGKSTLLDAAIKPFKLVCKDDVIEISRFTGPALQRYGSFDSKILYHNQAFGDEPQTVLPLLSEGNLGLMVTEKEENSSKFTTKIYNVEGMPVFCSTTVDTLDPQLMRRVIARTVDESPSQTRAVLDEQARAFEELEEVTLNPFPFVTKIIARVKDAKVHSRIDRVIIPFARQLRQKIPEHLEMRSNFPKFLKLIASICLVKSICFRGVYEVSEIRAKELEEAMSQYSQRNGFFYCGFCEVYRNQEESMKQHILEEHFPQEKDREERTKQIVALATIEDFQDAFGMAGPGFFQPLSAAEQIVLNYLSQRIESNKLNAEEKYAKVRMKELVRELGLARTYLQKITTHLSDIGLILKEDDSSSDRGAKVYQFMKDALQISDFGEICTTPEEWLESKSYRKLEVEDAFGVDLQDV